MSFWTGGFFNGAAGVYTPPTFVASTAYYGNTATSHAATAPTHLSGDLLIAVVMSGSATAPASAPAGWDAGPSRYSDTNVGIAIFTKKATGSEPGTYTFTFGSSQAARIFILSYRGADQIVAHNLATPSFTSADPQVAPSMAVQQDHILLAVLFLYSSSSTLTTGPSGMTSRASGFTSNLPRGAVFDQVVSASGASGTRSFDISTATFGLAFLVEVQ